MVSEADHGTRCLVSLSFPTAALPTTPSATRSVKESERTAESAGFAEEYEQHDAVYTVRNSNAAFNAAVPKARQVADPFHVVRLGNDALDEVRRRVQNQTLGHRGRKDDPLYRARKLLVSASENITAHGHTKLRGLLNAGDPYGEVRDAWHAKETPAQLTFPAPVGAATVAQLAADLQRPKRSTGSGAPSPWSWHAAAPTEAAPGVKRAGSTTASEPCSMPANRGREVA